MPRKGPPMPGEAHAHNLIDFRARAIAPKRAKHAAAIAAPPPLSIGEAFENFATAKDAAGRSPRTIESYGEAVGLLIAFLQRHDRSLALGDLTKRDIEDFLIEYRRIGANPDRPRRMSEAAVAVRYRSLRAFLLYMSR